MIFERKISNPKCDATFHAQKMFELEVQGKSQHSLRAVKFAGWRRNLNEERKLRNFSAAFFF